VGRHAEICVRIGLKAYFEAMRLSKKSRALFFKA